MNDEYNNQPVDNGANQPPQPPQQPQYAEPQPYPQQPQQPQQPQYPQYPQYQQPAQPQYQQPSYQEQAQYTPYAATPAYPPIQTGSAPGHGMGVTALVLGIVGLVLFWIPFVNVLFVLTSGAGIGLGAVSGKKAREAGMTNGAATAGLVLCIIALVLALISTVVCTILPLALGEAILDELGSGYYYNW